MQVALDNVRALVPSQSYAIPRLCDTMFSVLGVRRLHGGR
jgi:hypothetical protein